jgi:predicted metal-dependent phosphoesterase TrpH
LQELSEAELRELLPAAVEAGLLGMEVYHSSYDEQTSSCAQRIAKEFGLLPCGGSDFHGKNKPDISLGTGRGGMEIPREIYDNLLRWKSLQKDAL